MQPRPEVNGTISEQKMDRNAPTVMFHLRELLGRTDYSPATAYARGQSPLTQLNLGRLLLNIDHEIAEYLELQIQQTYGNWHHDQTRKVMEYGVHQRTVQAQIKQ